MVMVAITIVALLESVAMRNWAPLLAAAAAWGFIAIFILGQGTIFGKASSTLGSLTAPSGGTTPSVAQHSVIEALEVRGEYAKAAQAYRAVIAADPQDVVACEKLGQLALRELKEFDTAVWAYHQAEARSLDERRRQGYALIALGICRDNLRDAGRTVVELRKLLERYPTIQSAAALRAELDQLRAGLFAPSPRS